MIENVSTQLTVFHCFAHCLLPGRAFASLYALLFLEKEAEIGGRVRETSLLSLSDANIRNKLNIQGSTEIKRLQSHLHIDNTEWHLCFLDIGLQNKLTGI